MVIKKNNVSSQDESINSIHEKAQAMVQKQRKSVLKATGASLSLGLLLLLSGFSGSNSNQVVSALQDVSVDANVPAKIALVDYKIPNQGTGKGLNTVLKEKAQQNAQAQLKANSEIGRKNMDKTLAAEKARQHAEELAAEQKAQEVASEKSNAASKSQEVAATQASTQERSQTLPQTSSETVTNSPASTPQSSNVGSFSFLQSAGVGDLNGTRLTYYNPTSLGWSGSSIQGGINITPGADGVYRDASGNVAVTAAFNIAIGTIFSTQYGSCIVVDHCADQHYDLVVTW